MSDRELEYVGRTLAGVLRHFPHIYGLRMDEHGWVEVNRLVKAIKRKNAKLRWIKQHHIIAVVETDPKGRYEHRNGRVRATYGHTVNIELDHPTDGIPDTLYYPSTEEEYEILLETGIKPSDKIMVHLSGSVEAAEEAGKHRCSNPVILRVDAKSAREDGVVIQRAAPMIFLAKEIPAKYLSVERKS
ncbi:MAG: RNA 2'-phosphotransferase [Thermoplasmata archaeon]|nr:MAG: RNA 2'-phosphotransferase [Thermoplasmata archaeon]